MYLTTYPEHLNQITQLKDTEGYFVRNTHIASLLNDFFFALNSLNWEGYFGRRVIRGFGPSNVNPDDNSYDYDYEEAGEEEGQGKRKWKNEVVAR